MKKTLFLSALFLMCAAIFCPAHAEAADYVLFKDYTVVIRVQENNVLDVTESIDAYFDLLDFRHGIIREIPVKYTMNTDEGPKKYDIIVSGLQVPGHKTKVYRSGDYLSVRIGDADSYVSGDVHYTIHYKYDIGDDKTKGFDFVYFDVIGTEWNADIEKASFSVTLPKSFDATQIWTYVGAYGTKGENAAFTVDGNVITGQAPRALKPGEGITLQVQLPEDYFQGERVLPPFEIALYIFMGLLVAVSLLLFLLFGIDKKTIATVEFTAPDNLTPAEVGYIIDGCVDNKDAVSLVIYWADKGYIEIEEEKKNHIFLIKKKDLPAGARVFESAFFYGLFKGADRVSVNALKNTFYTTMQAVKNDISGSFEAPERRVFTRRSMRMQGLVGFFTALPFAATLFYAFAKDMGDFIFALMVSAIGLVIALPVIYSIISLLRAWRSTPRAKRVAMLIWRIVLLALVILAYYLVMAGEYELGALADIAVLATLIMAWLAVFMRKRTDMGTEWMGKILGLKNFIEKAEKDRIERLVQENPNYFYNILPFAYVLGVTEKWAKNFEDIGLNPEAPAWYHGYYSPGLFTTMVFMSSINHSLTTMSTAFVSRPAPKGGYSGGSGGGFGGGGFSGGGFGGGGGGSW